MPRFKANVKIGPWKVNDIFDSSAEHYEVLAAEGYLTKLDEQTPVEEPALELELWPPADAVSETEEPQETVDEVDISEWSGT